MRKEKRVVKRRWFSKKQNTWIEKTYVYEDGRSTKGKILVNKQGKINEKNVEKYKETIINNANLSEEAKRQLMDVLNQTINLRKDHIKELTTSGFRSLRINDPITRMFSNAGYSVEEVAEEYGLNVDDLLDQKNWNGSIYKGEWEFIFNYTGCIFKKCKN